jgi:predicted nucleic acid-binding protein
MIWSMASKIEAYVDTAAFISVLDRSDFYHSLFRRLFSSPPSLITSALVISEGHGWFLRRYDQQRAIQFLHFVDELPKLAIRAFDAADLQSASALLKKFADQNLTLADAHGLQIQKDLSIRICWSTDRQLSLTGASLVT